MERALIRQSFLVLVVLTGACGGGRGRDRDASPDGAGEPDGSVLPGDPALRGRGGPNRAPMFITMPPTTAEEGVSYRYAPLVDDLDGDLLVFELLTAPEGMQVSTETGVIYWLPGQQSAGDHPVHLRVTDEAAATAEQTWTITVTARNARPRIRSTPDNVATAGIEWSYAAVAEDPDGDTLTWALTESPAGMTLSGSTLRFTPPAAGSYPVTLRVSDPAGESDEQRFSVAINTFDPGPTVIIDSPAEGAEVDGEIEVVGTVADSDLASYTIRACSPEDSTNCRDFGTHRSAVGGGPLGTVDAGQLEPGPWNIEVHAVDAGGQTGSARRRIEVLTGRQMGSIRLAFTDIGAQVGGVFIHVYREYNGFERNDGDFGIGWRLGTTVETEDGEVDPELQLPTEPFAAGWTVEGGVLGAWVEGGPRFMTAVLPDGRMLDFDFDFEVVGPITGGWILAPSVFAPPGASITLLDGSGEAYNEMLWSYGTPDELVRWDGSMPLDPFVPTHFEVRTEFGEVYRFNGSGALESWIDETGRMHTWTGGTVDELESFLTVTRDGEGRITRLEDPESDTAVAYTYAMGDLVHVQYTGGDLDGIEQRYVYDGNHRMLSYDAPGHTLRDIQYDEEGRVIRVTDGTGAVTEYVYEEGRKIVISPTGRRLTAEHDEQGLVMALTDGEGGTTRYAYDAEGNRTLTVDPLGRETHYMYDAEGRPIAVMDAMGAMRRLEFTDNVIRHVDAAGNAVTYQSSTDGDVTVLGPDGTELSFLDYDDQGNLVQERDAAGEMRYGYDSLGRLTSVADEDGMREMVSYDATGLTATVTDMRGSDSYVARSDVRGRLRELTTDEGLHFQFDYDLHGRPRRAIDPNGVEYNFRRDGEGRLLRLEADGRILRQVRYDADGNPVSSVDADGSVTRIDYDLANRPTAIHNAGGVTRRIHDAAGQMVGMMDSRGRLMEIDYDPAGRPREVRLPDGNTASARYDGAGRITDVIDVIGRVRHREYDAFGNVVADTQPGAGTTRFTYGRQVYDGMLTRGQSEPPPLTSMTGPDGQTWRFGYDDEERLTEVTDPLDRVTRYQLDDFGTRGVTLPGDRQWSFTYTSPGVLSEIRSPEGRSWTFSEQPDGTIVERQPGGLEVRTQRLDGATVRTLPGGREERLRHGNAGLVEAVTPTSRTSIAYDPAGRIGRLTQDGVTLDYGYDEHGSLVELAATLPDGTRRVTRYTWDGDRLLSVVDPDGGETTYEYDLVSRPVAVNRPNGTRTLYSYGQLNRPTEIVHLDASGATAFRYDVTYDGAGRVASITGPEGRHEYSYNEMGWLASERAVDIGGETRWEYDATANMTARIGAAGREDATHDRDDRLLTLGATRFENDEGGARIAKTDGGGTTSYSYDALGRLLAVDGPGGGVDYEYDAQGLLVRRAGDGGDERCIWAPVPFDGNLPRCVVRLDGTDAELFVFDPLGVSSRHGPSGQRYVLHDVHGSVVGLTDDAGAVTSRTTYDAWGGLRGAAPAEPFPFGYTGEITDPRTGFVFLRTRWYDPATGRFLTPDSASAMAFDPRSFNRYAYVAQGTPLTHRDPNGEMTIMGLTVGQMFSMLMRAMYTVAVFCAKSFIIGTIRNFVFDMLFRIFLQGTIEAMLASLTGILAPVFAAVGQITGQAFGEAIEEVFCNRLGPSARESIEFRVRLDNCGTRQTNRGDAQRCPTPPGFHARPGPPGGELDLLIGEELPIELKAGRNYKEDQTVRMCRFSAAYGSRFAAILFGDWPPRPASGNSHRVTNVVTQPSAGWIGRLMKLCWECFTANNPPRQARSPLTGNRPEHCRDASEVHRSGFGSLLMVMGIERSAPRWKFHSCTPDINLPCNRRRRARGRDSDERACRQ